MSAPKLEAIVCPACNQSSFLKRAPRYEGFKLVGETLSCASCGHVFADQASVPLKKKKPVAGLDPANLAPPPRVFRADENARLCRYCANYVVNPFVQWCSAGKKEVEATDTCAQFKPRPVSV